MCALVGYIATGRTDISSTLIPTSTATLTLPPTTGNPESWASSGDGVSQSVTSVAVPAPTIISSVLPAISSELGLTIFNPPDSLSFVESPPPQTPQPSSSDSTSAPSPSSPCAEHDLGDPGQDIISRPTQDVLAITYESDLSTPVPSSSSSITPAPIAHAKLQARLSENHGKGKGRETIEDILYDLSLQLASSVSSVSQALDMDFIRALADSFNREVSEILALLDQFVREIKSQGVNLLEDPKRIVKKLKKKLTRVNKQARKNARNIAEVGERFFEMVMTNIETATSATRGMEEEGAKKTSRSARARERALKMHKKVFKSEEWLKHQRAVAERRAGALQIH